MPPANLTDARVAALRPRKSPYDIRDGKLRGFGVRVTPSGRKRFFIHCQHRGERVWEIVGDAGSGSPGWSPGRAGTGAGALSITEARSLAGEMLAAIRRGETALCAPGETLFEVVAEATFRRHERIWKPGTMSVNRNYLNKRILPHFAGRQIAEIDNRDVRNWFASLHATPVSADRSMPVLSVIMREAEAMGLRPEGSNPCRGIRRNRRKGRERFLSDDELRRLSERLAAHAGRYPEQVAIVRLLLLTGCRKGEILTLRWSDYREGHLFLRDSKTGPRTVWLSRPARDILDAIARKGSWVFTPSSAGRHSGKQRLHTFWDRVRTEAELGDARLHDLRHTYASHALRGGETVLVIGRLLGHADPETTLKYTHPADAMVAEAAERVGVLLGN